MAAVLLRLCDEDRAALGGDEWLRFDEAHLDDLDFDTLNSYESEFGISLEYLLSVDKLAKTARWTAARVWLALKWSGVKVPRWKDFNLKVRKVQVKPEKATKPKAADADPPTSSPSSDAGASETVSA